MRKIEIQCVRLKEANIFFGSKEIKPIKKFLATILILLCAVSILSSCTIPDYNSPSSSDAIQQNNQNIFYGDLALPDDLFSVLTVYNNSLLYLSLNENNEAGICRFDMNSGASSKICRLDDYLMNPANNTVLDGILYLNYMTKDAARKMIAIDMIHDTEKTILTEDKVQGMVYSAAVSGKVFSIKHTNEWKSVIDCYSPENGTTTEFLYAADDQVILAISVYDECLYALMHDETKGYRIVKYDVYGNAIDSWDTAYVSSILADSQVGRFQVMNETFFLENFSGESCVFRFDGTILSDLQKWSIATDTAGPYSQYVFFRRGSDHNIFCYDTRGNELLDIPLEIDEGDVIGYVFLDCNNPQRLLISTRNINTGEESVTIASGAE